MDPYMHQSVTRPHPELVKAMSASISITAPPPYWSEAPSVITLLEKVHPVNATDTLGVTREFTTRFINTAAPLGMGVNQAGDWWERDRWFQEIRIIKLSFGLFIME